MSMIAVDSSTLVDTLRFRLAAAKTLPRSAIRIGASVQALVRVSDADQDALVGRVGEVLRRFIDAAWTVSGVEREADSSGLERVKLAASAQVPARENHNLAERARRASEEGLAIVDPVVDYRLPGEVIAGATMDLQEKLLLMAMERAERFTAVTGRAWRIGDVQFGVGSEFDDGTSPKLLRREAALLAGGGEDLLTTSERLLLVAAVTLKVGGAVG
ncbi:MAG TPA: hypothetical protein PK818_09480 [Thermomonas sp.]|nr:hypothetical protein [Thermomonas sp.]